MRAQFAPVLISLLASSVSAKEEPVDPIKAQLYDSGAVHAEHMANKKAVWAEERLAGAFDSAQYITIDGPVPCIDGLATAIPGNANYTFKCNNIDLYHFLSHAELGSGGGVGSSSWGWTSDDGREFVAIGQEDGAAFVEISSEGKMIYLGRLPAFSDPSEWREIRAFNQYMVIGSEATGHGIQIFDMTKLLTVDPANPIIFSNEDDLTGHYTSLPVGSSHNIVTNPATGWVYAVGAVPRDDACKSGLIFINMTDPTNPWSPACNGDDGYVHDAQCIIYKGPDTQYNGHEICYAYNEDSLTIYDVTDKLNSSIISRTSYTGASYTHQGWVLDPEWQEYLLLDDELDEYRANGTASAGYPVTFIWDISSLASPKQTGYFENPRARSIDHNQYVIDGFTFQSNYGSGFAVLDVRSIPSDPTGAGIKEVAFFDIYPEDDGLVGGGKPSFVGTWSSYAYFKSGWIFINTMERGGWVVRLHDGVLA